MHTYKEAVDITKNMGFSDPQSLVRALQALGLLMLNAEPKKLIFNEILEAYGVTDTQACHMAFEANGYKIQKID